VDAAAGRYLLGAGLFIAYGGRLMQWRAAMLALMLGLGAPSTPLFAQDTTLPATLIADEIDFESSSEEISAEGNVEIFVQDVRLRAQSVTYNAQTDQVTLQGPITMIDGDGSSVLFAEFAELSGDLQYGILQSARLVLGRQLQIAATQINRSGGRYTQLYQTVASSCEVCAGYPVPLWQIRARRIVHDQIEQQLYFEQAQFRALGIPIAYFPMLRLPDPTLERSSGFLAPELQSNDLVGTGLRIPYFFTLGDHADLTITPYLTFGDSQTLEARYRQAFRNGYIEAEGAISDDALTDESTRSYLFMNGRFELRRDFRFDFDIEYSSDNSYLQTYGYSDLDRLDSAATISRARRDEFISFGVTYYESLRDTEDNRTLPTTLLDAEFTRRYVPPVIGGIATFSLISQGHDRRDESDITGRDMGSVTATGNWRRDWILPAGLVAAAEAEFYADTYVINQDSTYETSVTRFTPYLATELSWPLMRASANGVSHVIEPTIQLVWSPDDDGVDDIPNEDSVSVEFDEANLFDLNRFPGSDEREAGSRLTFGLTYNRYDPAGWTLGLTVGKVFRDEDQQQFTNGSGLDGNRSDWLIATHVAFSDQLRLINRLLLTNDLDITSNELGLEWFGDRYELGTSITWLDADAAEGRPTDTAEWAFGASYDFDNAWGGSVDWRYDFEANEPTEAGLSMTYATECVDVRFSISRRFTSSTTLVPANELGLTIVLNGFGASRNGRSYDRSCQQ
jgi:LPS-assembly protein